MPLPLAKSTMRSDRAPPKEAIFAIMELASTAAAANYAVEGFRDFIKRMETRKAFDLVKSSKVVLKKLEEFRDNVILQRESSGDPWSGVMSAFTDFQNMQQNLATKAAKAILAAVKSVVKVDLAISDSSQLARAFSSKDKSPEAKSLFETIIGFFDKLLNSWLAKNNMITRRDPSLGIVVYEGTENGKVRLDQTGKPMIAQPEKIRQLITDENKGLQRFMEDQGITATVQQHPFPQAKPKVEPEKPTPVAATKAEEKVVEAPAPEVISGPSGAR